jgi:hypothetical protein
LPIEPNLVGPIISRFSNLDECAINEANATLEFHQIMLNITCSCVVGHQISSPIASLMQDAMKMASSQTTLFDQFHTNASYMETLSCFIYRMNYKSITSGSILKDTQSECGDHLKVPTLNYKNKP